MKKFIIATLAVAVVATSAPVMAAPGNGHGNGHGNGSARHEVQDRRDDHGPRDDAGRRNDRRPAEVRREVVVVKKSPAPHRVEHRVWRRGDRFDHRHAPRYVVIDNPRHYHLHDAPRGYRWVRSGNDAVLVGIASGIVAAVVTSVLIN